MRRLVLISLTCLLYSVFFLGLHSPAYGKIQSVQLSVEVPPGQWKAARIRNLPKNSVVKVDLVSDSKVSVSFVNQANYQSYPNRQTPLYQGKVKEGLTFTVKIPTYGNYYLVLDNRVGARRAKLAIFVQGAVGREAVLLMDQRFQEQVGVLERKFSQAVTGLSRLFIFDPFPIKIKICGKKKGAFSGPQGVVLCLEFVHLVQKIMGDKEKAANVLLFALFHEVGHVLLKQWDSPFYNNEEVADEFATVLLVMLGQKKRLAAVPEYFITQPSLSELLGKTLRYDRHPLSIQRARNILGWVKDPSLIRRWQTIFVPHMQTAVLEKLGEHPPAWADRALITAELAKRKQRQGP